MEPYYEADGITLYNADCLEHPWLWDTANVLITDPPYGMAFVSSWTTRRPIAGDQDATARDAVLAIWGDRPAVVFGTWRVPRPPGTRQVVIWHKASVGPGMGDLTLPWGNATEEVYIIGKGWNGPRRQNLISTSEQRGGTVGVAALLGHPTPKPVGLMQHFVDASPHGVIADPFAGVGATLIAARNAGRKAVGVEISEAYCETAARRLDQQDLFGGAA